MKRALAAYRLAESVLGRSGAWRIGRLLYRGARRELVNDPALNGEYALQDWVLRASPDGAIIAIDVGANVGEWTLEMSRKLGTRSASLVAFEPVPALHARLTEALHGVAEVRPEAVTDRVGEMKFHITGENTGTNALEVRGPADAISVPTTTIDAVAPGRIHLLKIDTEGNDLNVLLGAADTIREHRVDVIQFEFNWRWTLFRSTLLEVFDLAHAHDYAVGQLTSKCIEIHADWHPELERTMETNFVLLAPGMEQRLRTRRVSFNASNVVVSAA